MFGKPKFKKVDVINYKGFEIPIYSDGKLKFAGHPIDPNDVFEESPVYNIDDISKLKETILAFNSGGNWEEKLPKRVGFVKISVKK